jgi:hypothetical protein
MNRSNGRFGQYALTTIGLAIALITHAIAEAPVDPPKWISQVPVMRSGDAQSFRFRANLDMFGIRLIACVSWAPPDHRCVILCDGSDGLPLVIAVDGHAWVYDLVSGQILQCKDEPSFEMNVKDGRVSFTWGVNAPDQGGIIHVDFASIFGRKAEDLRTTEDRNGRVAALTASQSQEMLRVTSSNPPRPMSVLFVIPKMDPPGRMEFDAFQFGAPLPPWHHLLDADALVKDAPFCDMEDMKDLPNEKQELLETFKQLMAAGGAFLIRPAIHDESARRKLEQLAIKVDFKQMELHEKLLSKAWLSALKHQGIDPAKFALPLPSEWTK